VGLARRAARVVNSQRFRDGSRELGVDVGGAKNGREERARSGERALWMHSGVELIGTSVEVHRGGCRTASWD
jgi:hypothetical protein